MRLFATVLVTLSLVGCGEERALREWTPADHGQPEGADVDPERVPDNEARGNPVATLWNLVCASCHGRSGRGDGPGRPPMATQMPDLTTAEYQQVRTDEQIAETIRAGRGFMPGFASQLDPDAIESLVAHVRSLRSDTNDR